MEAAVGAARWVVSKALGPVTDGVLELWADVHNPALGHLLFELRGLAYNADDVLDELEYFRIQDELEGTYETADADDRGLIGGLVLNTHHTVNAIASKLNFSCCSVICSDSDDEDNGDSTMGCLPIGSCPLKKWQQVERSVHAPKLKFDRVELSKRMADIVEQLKPICAKVATILDMELLGSALDKLELLRSDGTTTQSASLNWPRTSTPLITQPQLYGREHLKRDLVHAITRGKHHAGKITVYAVVRPGGIGKTTFTQHVYQEVSNQFQVKIWICVSQDFNATRLVKEIVSKIPSGDDEKANATDEDLIQTRLQLKRLLLVLDDMWACREDDWQRLLAPLKNTQGNVVVVTTRIPKLAAMRQSWEGHMDLQHIGLEIVNRLKGFPLVVKTVGRLLRNKTIDHWKRVLESKEWEFQSSDDDDIMPVLKLSYNYLPFDVQQCFSCCALFPEDYKFDREELIHFCIGFGLLGTRDQNKKAEDIGLDRINELVDHGFLEKGEKEDGRYYTVHDLLHELALISSYECLIINGLSNVRSVQQVPASICHLSIIVNDTDVKDRKTYESCKNDLRELGKRMKVENLRTLMLFGEYHGNFSKTFGDLFGKAKALRVLFLSGATYRMDDLLPMFSEFVHLRYLRIKGDMYPCATLPNYISRFYHLLVLDLQCNSLFPFVRELRNLVKIRHILVKDEKFHSEISEVGELKHLQGLRTFEVKKDINGFELKQLGHLQELQGSLKICNLERVEEMAEADEAKLLHMKHLHRLVLEWEPNRSNSDPKREEDVLESLKQNSNVREICMRGHGGSTCPTWLGADLYVNDVECLELGGLAWKVLPPLGEFWMVNEHGKEYLSCITGQSFQHLKRIDLSGIQSLRRWHGNGTQSFPVLYVLTVSDCPELIELPLSHTTTSPAEQEKMITMFPKLREIKISDCENLLSLPPFPWTSTLSQAEISKAAGFVQLNYVKRQQIKWVDVVWKDTLDKELWSMFDFKNLRETEDLTIIECPPVPFHQLQLLASLKTVNILGCHNVLWPVEGVTDTCYTFPVECFRINMCGATGKELTIFFSYFPNLSKLDIFTCERVTGLAVAKKQAMATPAARPPTASDHKTVDGQGRGEEEIRDPEEGILLLPPPQIQELDIRSCPNLRLCSGSLDEDLASLRVLRISGCRKFLSSSSYTLNCPFPNSVQTLYLSNIEGIFTLVPLSNLTDLFISDCGDVRGKVLWPLLAQGHVTKLTIHRCPNIFVASELSPQDEQNSLLSCRLQVLFTDGKDGILAVPTCSSLTMLCFGWNNDIEQFTTEQEQDLQKLTSLQELEISYCNKLQSLPAGLSTLPKLKRLEIKDCQAIQSFPKDGLPNSLTELKISESKEAVPRASRHNSNNQILRVLL
ncbi:unnamed protein product [Urochloa decumbens]|uniref:AAA+ ATPase domain-containing protein n=1 Tax=Urochloa decumbens TaxID=240449 RepID=A0ABC9GFJ3_9POAL